MSIEFVYINLMQYLNQLYQEWKKPFLDWVAIIQTLSIILKSVIPTANKCCDAVNKGTDNVLRIQPGCSF